MPDTPAARPSESATVPVPSAPPSVRYAQVLLFVQGSIWAMGAIAGVMVAIVALTGILHGSWTLYVVAVGGSVFGVGMATVEIQLAVRLGRGRCRRVRKAVIAVELAMTCFGVLWFSTPYSGPVADLAGMAGCGLSLAAAGALMRRRARQYAAADAVHTEVTGPGPTSGQASFWRQFTLARA